MTDDELKMVRDLLDLDEGLNDWEIEFLDNLNNHWEHRNLTDRQLEKLEEIHDRKRL